MHCDAQATSGLRYQPEENQNFNEKARPAGKYKAKYIISGDKHLLALKAFQKIKILSPKAFLGTLWVPGIGKKLFQMSVFHGRPLCLKQKKAASQVTLPFL